MMKILTFLSLTLFSCVFLITNDVAGIEVTESNQIKKISVSAEKGQFNPGECFDKIWQIINKEFWDPNFNGVDWENAGKHYRPKALAAKNHEEFAIIVNQMLGELKTSHTRYFTRWEPEYYTLQAALISGDLKENNTTDTSVLERNLPGLYSSQAKPHRTGIGIVTQNLNDRHYVTAVLASSPAEKAGIVLGDWIVEVNGKPFHPKGTLQHAVQ